MAFLWIVKNGEKWRKVEELKIRRKWSKKHWRIKIHPVITLVLDLSISSMSFFLNKCVFFLSFIRPLISNAYNVAFIIRMIVSFSQHLESLKTLRNLPTQLFFFISIIVIYTFFLLFYLNTQRSSRDLKVLRGEKDPDFFSLFLFLALSCILFFFFCLINGRLTESSSGATENN